MNKYIVFRTDRIGDFLLSAILIKCIKSNDPNSHITVIASEKNYQYIKTFSIVDETFLLKSNIIDKIKLIFKLRNSLYKAIILHDGKKRSSLISFFLKKKLILFSLNPLNISHIDQIKNFINELDFKFYKNNLNIFEGKVTNFSNFKKKYIVFHFDEKWIHKEYIKHYIDIEPSKNELLDFFNKIIKKTDLELVITTGTGENLIINEIINTDFNNRVKIYKELNFFQLEEIISKSIVLISCHGSVSHIASGNNIKQIDIIDKSYDYSKWTKHFRNYNYINRDKFSILSQKILLKL